MFSMTIVLMFSTLPFSMTDAPLAAVESPRAAQSFAWNVFAAQDDDEDQPAETPPAKDPPPEPVVPPITPPGIVAAMMRCA